jgi:hypothetical protein
MSVWNAGLDDLMGVQKLTGISTNQSGNKPGRNSTDNFSEKHEVLPASVSPSPLDGEDLLIALTQKIPLEQESLHLKELIDRLQKFDLEIQNPTTFLMIEPVEIEMTFSSAQRVDGLLVHNNNQAESDRYLFNFTNGTEFIIIDKWTKCATRIWGDPFINLDDIEGDQNDKFSEEKINISHNTFMLMDGTHVTFIARDNGIIQTIEIVSGSHHIHGSGQAAENWSTSPMFNTNVLSDGITSEIDIPLGDTVFAGGNGNDWYSASGKLLWSCTTSPFINKPPSPKLELMMKQVMTESLPTHRVEKSV